MSWAADEWAGFMLCLERWWKDPLDDSDRMAWKLAIDDVDPATAVQALKQQLRRGGTWRPSVAEFVASLSPVAPTWEEAWPAIRGAMARLRPGEDGSTTIALVLGAAGPEAAGWLASYGVWRLAAEPVDDPAFGGAVVKRLRDNYEEITGSPAGRDRLLRAVEEGPRLPGLRRVDPLRLLGLGEDAA